MRDATRLLRETLDLKWTLTMAALALAMPALAVDGDSQDVTVVDRVFHGLPQRIVVAEPYAYAAMDTGLEILDLTRATPVVIGELYLASPVFDLAMEGNLVYLANGESGLSVVDVSDPSAPWVVETAPRSTTCSGLARGIAVRDGLAYLAETSPDCGGLLRVLDVTAAAGAVELGRLVLDNGALSVAVVGATALVGIGDRLAGRHGLVAVDVSDPRTPVESSMFLDTYMPVNQIAVDGSIAYLAVGVRMAGALISADVTEPMTPVQLDRRDQPSGALGLGLAPPTALLAMQEGGLRTFDISDPTFLRQTGSLAIGDYAVAVAATGSRAVVCTRSASGTSAVVAVDTPIGLSPQVVGRSLSADATGVAIAGGRALVLRRSELSVFEGALTAEPALASRWALPDADFSTMAADRAIAAIAEGDRIHLVDIASDPPQTIASTSVRTGMVLSMVIDGETLYAVTGRDVEILDISRPIAPRLLGGVSAPGAVDLAVDGAMGYLVGDDTLTVLDLSMPSNPSAVGTLAFRGERLTAVAAAGPLVVVTASGRLLYTVDVLDPGMPAVIGSVVGDRGRDVAISGDRALVAAGEDGLEAVDISAPSLPRVEAYHDTSGTALGIAVSDRRIWLAAGEAQHWVLDLDAHDAPMVVGRGFDRAPWNRPIDPTVELPGAGGTVLIASR